MCLLKSFVSFIKVSLKAFVVVCMRNIPNGLTCLNSWSQLLVLSGQVTGGAGWLEEVSHWEQALSIYSLDPFSACPWLRVCVCVCGWDAISVFCPTALPFLALWTSIPLELLVLKLFLVMMLHIVLSGSREPACASFAQTLGNSGVWYFYHL